MTTPARDGQFGDREAPRHPAPDGLRVCPVVPGDEPEGAGRVQALYCEMAHTAWAELRRRAECGDNAAGRWLERFLALGEQLGVRVTHRQAGAAAAFAAAVHKDALDLRGVPSATYRLQFNRNFTFHDARDLVP